MKTTSARLMFFAMAILFCTLAVSNTFASTNSPVTHPYTDTLNDIRNPEPYLRLNEINIRAARTFEKQYPHATAQKWLKISSGYLVKFTDKGIPIHIYFDHKGHIMVTTRYFNGFNMPASVKKTLNKSYPGYTIGVVTEATTTKVIFFHIDIRNEHSVKLVRVHESVVELINDSSL